MAKREKNALSSQTKYPAHEHSFEVISEGYQPIEDYGLIGDLRTAALVGRDGSIDFMCYPRFDSPSIFCAMLDVEKGGRFQITPVLSEVRQKKLYLSDTNILISRFLSESGVAEVSDFMVLGTDAGEQALVRRVKTVRGEVRFRVICEPRFGYATVDHKAELTPEGALFVPASGEQPALRLRTQVRLRLEDGCAVSEFNLRQGETAYFILEAATPALDSPASASDYVSASFKATVNYWRRWISRSNYRGRWREMINRSALVLKLLTSSEFGSIVAAPTFGLPTEIGGERNWDYRYTWIRDATFTLYALMRLGFTDEAEKFMSWLHQRCEELPHSGSLKIMYGLDGRAVPEEVTLTHFEGYRKSSPVRIGNAASDHLQLDIYGELMDSVYLFDKYSEMQPISHRLWSQLVGLIDWVCSNWHRKDASIWEIRGNSQEFLYSRLMCWVAIDRGIRLSDKRSLPAPLGRWLDERNKIFEDIQQNFWSNTRQAFVQHKGSESLDAATLMMPLVRFISPIDPTWHSTMRAIEKDLVEDSLVFRYRIGSAASDGLSGNEGTFSICSFWYIECLSREGDVQKARFLFEKMLGYANDLGLYAEQLGPRAEFLGNVPQAFTHIALISAAYELDRRLNAAGVRG